MAVWCLCRVLLGLVFYGMEAMSLKLCNPFGWDNEGRSTLPLTSQPSIIYLSVHIPLSVRLAW